MMSLYTFILCYHSAVVVRIMTSQKPTCKVLFPSWGITANWLTMHALQLGSYGYKEKSENWWVLCIDTLWYMCLKTNKNYQILHSIMKKNSTHSAGIEQIKWSLNQYHLCLLQSLCMCWIASDSAKACAKTVFGHINWRKIG